MEIEILYSPIAMLLGPSRKGGGAFKICTGFVFFFFFLFFLLFRFLGKQFLLMTHHY